MKKKSLFLIIVVLFSISLVNAEEIYFTNDNGVAFTQKEYYFINEMFYEGFQNIMTIKDYNNIFEDKDILNSEINSKSIIHYDNSMLRSTIHETASKLMTIKSSCVTNCIINVSVEWKKSPNVRSYDVIGAYLDGVELKVSPTTYVKSSGNITSSSEIVTSTNGFGTSIKLISSGSDMIITQYYTVSKGGTVYASYQHATSAITLSNSKKYTISRSGYGGVFLFNSSVSSYYDGMGGVNISV